MGVTRQIYRLQELDLEIESSEKALQSLTSRLGESPEIVQARTEITVEKGQLEELKKQLRFSENDIKDLEAKIKTGNEELYSGKIKNPKELSNLQTEMQSLKAKKGQLEERALTLMDQSEEKTVKVEASQRQFEDLKARWQKDQEKLTSDIEILKSNISTLQTERQQASAAVSQQIMELYLNLKRQKKRAVVKVEKGACTGCRISLPITDLQRARSGRLIQCSSCGRILHVD